MFNSEDEFGTYVGPGINVADSDINDYPEAYQMMPVGGYFTIDEEGNYDNPCELEDGADLNYHKHVVQMRRIPNEFLKSIVPNEDGEEIPKSLYFFDVQNAHDGLCDCP